MHSCCEIAQVSCLEEKKKLKLVFRISGKKKAKVGRDLKTSPRRGGVFRNSSNIFVVEANHVPKVLNTHHEVLLLDTLCVHSHLEETLSMPPKRCLSEYFQIVAT